MNRKGNTHYKDTHRRIQNAAMTLMKESPNTRLSVRRICEKAAIHHTTFYAHYESMENLLQEMSDIHAIELKHLFDDAHLSTGCFYTMEGLRILLNHIKTNPGFYAATLSVPGKLQQTGSSFKYLWEGDGRNGFWREDVDYGEAYLSFIQFFGGMYTVIEHWLSTGCAEEIDQIARVISSAIPRDLLRNTDSENTSS